MEYRHPLTRRLTGVVFVDAALLGEGAVRDLPAGTGAITPGVGVHFATPAGPDYVLVYGDAAPETAALAAASVTSQIEQLREVP